MCNKIPSIAIVGAGAIGGVTAAFMTEAGWAPQVVCKHVDTTNIALNKGLHVFGLKGERHVHVNAVQDISDLKGKIDFLFLAVKATEVLDAAEKALPLLHKESAVVTMQNGICEEAVAEVVGRERVIGCVVVWGATMHGPGELEVTSPGEFVIGNLFNPEDDRLPKVREMLQCVFPTRISENIMGELYSKLVINSCINSLGAITGATLGDLLKTPKVRGIFLELMREMMRTADAMKIKVEPGSGGKLDYYRLIEDRGFLSKAKRHLVLRIAGFKYRRIKSSTLQSLERGRQSEIDYLNGYVCQQGRRFGIATPLNDTIVAMVKEIEVGKRPISWQNLEAPSFAEYG